MAIDHIDHDDLLLTFDDLTVRGIVQYSPGRTVQLDDDGFPLEFHISGALSNKPNAGDSLQPEGENPICFGRGSDIAKSDPKQVITTICDTHWVIVNKFSVFRPHLLLLTVDSYRRQSEQLGLDDFRAVCNALVSLQLPYYAMYNCTLAAGSSREHKHVQIIPRPRHFFPDDQNFAAAKIPYKYFLKYLDDGVMHGPSGPQVLLQIYEGLLDMAKQALGLHSGQDDLSCSHNAVVTKEWIIVIPRRSNNFKQVTANAAGMMGSVWLKDDTQLKQWKAVGPKHALSHLGLDVGGA